MRIYQEADYEAMSRRAAFGKNGGCGLIPIAGKPYALFPRTPRSF